MAGPGEHPLRKSEIGTLIGGAALSLMAGIAAAHLGLAPMRRALDRAEAPAAVVAFVQPAPLNDVGALQAAAYRPDDNPAVVRFRAAAPRSDLQHATGVSTDDSVPTPGDPGATGPGDGPSIDDAQTARADDGPPPMIVNPYTAGRDDLPSETAGPSSDEPGSSEATPPAPTGNALQGL
jgi:hypothetical protein